MGKVQEVLRPELPAELTIEELASLSLTRNAIRVPMVSMNRRKDDHFHTLLAFLGRRPHLGEREEGYTAEGINVETGLGPSEVNQAAQELVELGLAEWTSRAEASEYCFSRLWLSSRGRHEYKRTNQSPRRARALQPAPIGSPYGFQSEDWEEVSTTKNEPSVLRVVLGFQFKSDHYDPERLRENLRLSLERATERLTNSDDGFPVHLDFRPLAAGYGEHLFNRIARDIISADIAVFDASDLNPNVMIEVGVALTWGVRLFLIKKEGRPLPPSDISGHAWVEYLDSAREFLDPDHDAKLFDLVRRVMTRKARPRHRPVRLR